MAVFLIFAIVVLCIAAFVFLVQVPIYIARGRGISGSELTTIIVLSWCGLFLGVTWIVALVLALVWQPGQWIDKSGTGGDVADKIEKLHKLKQRGVITAREFDLQKKKLLD
jgi:hypothetical protein